MSQVNYALIFASILFLSLLSSPSVSGTFLTRSRVPRLNSPFERISTSTCSIQRPCHQLHDPIENCPVQSHCQHGQCTFSLTPCSVAALNHKYKINFHIDWDEVNRHNNDILHSLVAETSDSARVVKDIKEDSSTPIPEEWFNKYAHLRHNNEAFSSVPFPDELIKLHQGETAVANSIDYEEDLDEDGQVTINSTQAVQGHTKLGCKSCNNFIMCTNDDYCFKFHPRAWCHKQKLDQVDSRVSVGICQVTEVDYRNHRWVNVNLVCKNCK